jgi:hypothetical protein
MNKKILLLEWKNERDKIAKLTFSKKNNVHQLLTRYSDNGWTLNDPERKAVSQYIHFLEKQLNTIINDYDCP